MRFIKSSFHAIIDYASGAFMLCLPWLVSSADQPHIRWLALLIGIVILLQAMLTCYEGGIVGLIPLHIHLVIDIALGIAIIIAALMIGISGTTKIIFIVAGALAILFGIFTRLRPKGRSQISNHFKN